MNGFIWCRTAKLPKDVKGKYLVYRGNKTLITGNTRKTMREALYNIVGDPDDHDHIFIESFTLLPDGNISVFMGS
jgi:hypothetical protein